MEKKVLKPQSSDEKKLSQQSFNHGSAAKMPRNNIKATAQFPSSFVLLSQPPVKCQYFLTSPEMSTDMI